MRCTRKQADGRETIIFEGNLTISNAGEIKEVIREALAASEDIRLDLGQVAEVDLSCLQLFCSAHRTAKKLEKSLTFTGNCPEVMKRNAELAGFSRHMGCTENCLWTGFHELH